MGHVFDTLVKQQPLGTYHPGLATSWSVSDDATEYIFELRDDVSFHDGTPFNAAAVKYTFDRIVDPDTKSQMAFSFIGPYAESEVLGDYSIAVRFSSPNAAFLDGVSHPQLGPVSPTAVEALGADWGFSGSVGTGPFVFESYVPDSEVVMVKNPDYSWGNADVFGRSGPTDIDRLVFKILTDPGTRLAALESGEVDMINGVPGLDVARLDESEDFVVTQYDQAGHGYSFMFNQIKSPTDELAVRRAIAQAIDIDIMQDIVYDGLGSRACSALTQSMFGWTDAFCQANPYDPDAAGAILDEAGWVMNEETGIRERDGVPLTIEHWSPDRPLSAATAQFLAEDMAALGVDFQINLADIAAYLTVVRAGEHNTQQWWDTQTDPDGVFRTLYHSSNAGGGTNRNNYRNGRYGRHDRRRGGHRRPGRARRGLRRDPRQAGRRSRHGLLQRSGCALREYSRCAQCDDFGRRFRAQLLLGYYGDVGGFAPEKGNCRGELRLALICPAPRPPKPDCFSMSYTGGANTREEAGI